MRRLRIEQPGLTPCMGGALYCVLRQDTTLEGGVRAGRDKWDWHIYSVVLANLMLGGDLEIDKHPDKPKRNSQMLFCSVQFRVEMENENG